MNSKRHILVLIAAIAFAAAAGTAPVLAATCGGETATIVGTSGADVLVGTSGNYGGDRGDFVQGDVGDDSVHAAGRVVDPAGRPLGGVRLEAAVTWSPPYPRGEGAGLEGVAVLVAVGRPSSSSDEEGRYRIDGAPPGSWKVVGRHLRYDRVVREVEILPGPNVLDLVFDGGSEVRGRVVDVHGEGVPGVELCLFGGRRLREHFTRSAADGSFRLPEIGDGDYSLRATKPGYATVETAEAVRVAGAPGGAPARVRASVPGEPVEVALAPAGRLKVRLPGLVESNVHARLRLAGRDAAAFRSFDRATGRVRDAWELENGSTTVEGLPAGEWDVRVVAANGATWQGVVVSTGAPLTEVEIQ